MLFCYITSIPSSMQLHDFLATKSGLPSSFSFIASKQVVWALRSIIQSPPKNTPKSFSQVAYFLVQSLYSFRALLHSPASPLPLTRARSERSSTTTNAFISVIICLRSALSKPAFKRFLNLSPDISLQDSFLNYGFFGQLPLIEIKVSLNLSTNICNISDSHHLNNLRGIFISF